MTDPTGNQLPPPALLAQVVARVNRPDWERFNTLLHAAGCCTQPVRLKGRVLSVDPTTGQARLDYSTAGEPDRVLLKACGTRRATRCPACAALYKLDARILITAGLTGGKGTPDTVAEHPAVFATLTAPSYGPVHAAHQPPAPCRTDVGTCGHRRPRGCSNTHLTGDPIIGGPICDDCYDYPGAVMFNARVNELWRRTTITTRRALAGYLGIGTRDIDDHHRLAYLKVVEYQHRGLVHLHVLARLDPAKNNSEPVDPGALNAALRTGAAKAAAPNPQRPDRPIRWGPQLDTRPLDIDLRRAAANYLAKYATKSSDPAGALDHRLHSPDLTGLNVPDHLAAMAEVAWHLGGQPHLQHLNLRLWAHTLGYRGHWLTKSPHWSTTFTALRTARHHWQLEQHGHTPDDPDRRGQWDYHGQGHTTPGDTWLAQTAHHNKTLNQRTAWEEK